MDFSIKLDPGTWQHYLAARYKGRMLLMNPLTNKASAFSMGERDDLDLHGLLPPVISSIDQQLQRNYRNFQSQPTDLDKYIFLASLQDRNEVLFYRMVYENLQEMMPIVYTPTVGEACQKFSLIYRKSRGLYIAHDQRHLMDKILSNFHCQTPSVIVVTDGERILGLGDQGAGGMGIAIGKLALYTLCGGISPYGTLPIMLDVGTDNQERIEDPLYLGLRQPRIRGDAYQEFIDQFVTAVQKRFPNVLLQWEDFLKANAIHQLDRFRDRLCTFNDDIQGTGAVILAAIYSGLRVTGGRMRDQRAVLLGGGASAKGIADLFVAALMEDGLTKTEARRRVWMVDTKGLITGARIRLEPFKATYARDLEELAGFQCADRSRVSLEEAIANVRPTILIGSSGATGRFTREVVELMASHSERPMVFPISNPTSRAECTAEQVIRWSNGRALVVTGSPFDPVDYQGKRYRIGQGNNAFIFPGVGLGVTFCRARRMTDGMFLDAAKALAGQVTREDLDECALVPDIRRIRDCSLAVALATVQRAMVEGLADNPPTESLETKLRAAMWTPEYLQIRYER